MYQIDRTACSEVGEQSGSDVHIKHRLQWIDDAKEGKVEHVTTKELEKYLRRGTADMPWEELSQEDFVKWVVPYKVILILLFNIQLNSNLINES